MHGGLDRHWSRLISIELEGCEEVHILKSRDMPAGNEALRSFSKRLQAHHPGQHGSAFNLMIVQKRLQNWVKSRLDIDARLNVHTLDLADHYSRTNANSTSRRILRGFERRYIES